MTGLRCACPSDKSAYAGPGASVTRASVPASAARSATASASLLPPVGSVDMMVASFGRGLGRRLWRATGAAPGAYGVRMRVRRYACTWGCLVLADVQPGADRADAGYPARLEVSGE